ncbi:hypothetical protein MWU50_08315 [Flavobacteriaceae bacterium S0862]|nr:hypothetical protein [Flavobacteriaceae bacterium S0862]
MKTIVLGLLIIGFTTQIHSQTNNLSIFKNIKYLEKVKNEGSPVIIKKMENIAAEYDIQKADVFNPKRKGTYDVTFEETSGKIVATYNKKGKLIKTIEVYNNLKLPLQVSKSISKEYPGWIFTGNTHEVLYNKGKVKKLYRIQIKNNNSKKELKFELKSGAEANYAAVN